MLIWAEFKRAEVRKNYFSTLSKSTKIDDLFDYCVFWIRPKVKMRYMASLKLFWKHHVGIKASKKHLVCVLSSYLPGRIGMWISNFSKKSKFDWFLKSQIFAIFSPLFGPIRPGSVTLVYAQYFWSNVHVKESSKQGHIWAEDTFWCGPNSILKCQKSDIFTLYQVEIRPKRIEMLFNSAQRIYIWKLHQKC